MPHCFTYNALKIQMSTMEALEGYRADRGQSMRATAPAEGYVKEFTRHSNDVLLNLNELRHRSILTDTTLIVGNVHLQAHCAVLVACRLVDKPVLLWSEFRSNIFFNLLLLQK